MKRLPPGKISRDMLRDNRPTYLLGHVVNHVTSIFGITLFRKVRTLQGTYLVPTYVETT